MTTTPVSIRNLNHSYGRGESGRQILFDVSAEIKAGEIVILTGPSGSGKSTLLTLIGALRSVQDGEVTVLGESLRGAGAKTLNSVRRQIGFIFQHHNLLDSLTIEQNVQMGLELHPRYSTAERRTLAEQALESVGLKEQIGKYPRFMSGGQKQRVAVARALVVSPKMILADEPTGALDKDSGRAVVDLLQELARERGVAVALVTHDNRILDVADRILHLEDGRLIPLGQAVQAQTQKMMSLYSQAKRHEDLTSEVLRMPDAEFLALLESITLEARQFLEAMEVAGSDTFEAMLDQALAAFSRKIESVLEAERVSLFLVDESRGELWAKIARDESDVPVEIRIPLDSGIAGLVARTGETVNIPDAYADPRFNRSVDQKSGYRTRCILAIPFIDADGRVLGVAQALNRTDGQPFDEEDERRFAEFMPSLQALLESWIKMRSWSLPSGTQA